MTQQILNASVLVLTTAAFFAASVDFTLALPLQPLVAAPSGGIVMIECKQGTKNCTTGTDVHPGAAKIPKGTEIPNNGWQDPDCKEFKNCGYAGSPDAKKAGAAGTTQSKDHLRFR